MKLELLDAYHIRARLCAYIILLSPAAITICFCFSELTTIASSSVLLFILFAFTNYIPILQRMSYKDKMFVKNYAAQFLWTTDTTIGDTTKARYYDKLSCLDKQFSLFSTPSDSEEFHRCCESAVGYLRTNTRDNRLLLEENITYGFCKNLFANKPIAIVICGLCILSIIASSFFKFQSFLMIPGAIYLGLALNIALLLFWIVGVTKVILEDAATRYALTLLSTIDSL